MMSKEKILLDNLRGLESAVVAFSGGVDSSLLLSLAFEALGDKCVALTFSSPLLARWELDDAARVAREIGMRHVLVETNELKVDEVKQNGRERCYYCKRERLKQAIAFADREKLAFVLDGSNTDDEDDYRPGLRALKELMPRVKSPFLEAGLSKEEVRSLARKRNLSVSEKLSSACLASRIEYDTLLTRETLYSVEGAEEFLRSFVKGQLRVRRHGNLARIEVEGEEFDKILQNREKIADFLKKHGFLYVSLDLIGYRTGSHNEIFEAT